jgi:hypothetical protein
MGYAAYSTAWLIPNNLCPGTDFTGSEHNDEFYMDEAGNVRTRTNRSGGVQVFILKSYYLCDTVVVGMKLLTYYF